MGTVVAQAIFQSKLDSIFIGIESGMRGIRNYLGNGKVSLLPVWKGIYIGN